LARWVLQPTLHDVLSCDLQELRYAAAVLKSLSLASMLISAVNSHPLNPI